jgi:hypothetical protein
VTTEVRQLAGRIVDADRLFSLGRFEDSLRSARALLMEVTSVPGRRGEQWRAELLGLAGRGALHLYRLEEALEATRAALHGIHALQDETLEPLLDGLRENLLTILAALESPVSDRAATAPPVHRELRSQIVRAQALTDRYRFSRSIETLEPLVSRLEPLGQLPASAMPSPEPVDARLWYLPRMLGLLGFNWFHCANLGRARALTDLAIDASRALGDRTGERVYRATLDCIDRAVARESP